MNILKCPICNLPLQKVDNIYKCSNNHTFDISSKAYTNLLLVNQTSAKEPGDQKEMVEARINFLKSEKYQILKNKLTEIISTYIPKSNGVFADIACGEGYYTCYIHDELSKVCGIKTIGIDLSKSAIKEAGRKVRVNHLENIDFYIGNMMYLPLLDNSIDVLLNCFAPIFVKEFDRVLKKGAIFIRVLPGKDHLLGLKKVLYKDPYLNEKKEEKIEDFTLLDEITLSETIDLNNQEINDVFKMTPYYYKSPKDTSKILTSLPSISTPISFTILIYKKV